MNPVSQSPNSACRGARLATVALVVGLLYPLIASTALATPTLTYSRLYVSGSLYGVSGIEPASYQGDYPKFIDESEFSNNPGFGGSLGWNSALGISADQDTSATVSSVGPLLDFDASFSVNASSIIDFGVAPGSRVRVESFAQLILDFDVDVASMFEITDSAYSLASTNATLNDYFQIFDLSDPSTPLFDVLPSAGGTFDTTDVLAPGSYQLRAQVFNHIDDNGSANQDLGFSFRVVPEPGTALLIGVGLGWMAVRRFR